MTTGAGEECEDCEECEDGECDKKCPECGKVKCECNACEGEECDKSEDEE